ncbi:DUF3888 domain-containing protein [Ectobacillus ponti]|uniref:DUF3888 domain-containing protein n=1 Tax=Ectobacillus ponti TaxID=2961894 RepID=A0AA42BQP4_9BACI|nr:DUF3888 domain-containing protein [Ectobacillus ponti]MCP8968664.1 DUF3888 domain-containing protein [Ectobacillus ponti]
MILSMCAALCLSASPCVQAAQSPDMLEDALYSVLFPKINMAVEKHYGRTQKYDCLKIASMKKVYSGTYVFQAEIELITFRAVPGGEPKPPFEKVTIPFNNEEGEWEAGPVKIQKLPDDTKLKCRKPL